MRKLGDDDNENKAVEGGSPLGEDKSNWVSVPNSEGVVREVKERRVLSREEREDTRETEDIQHLGDITDEVSLHCFIYAYNKKKTSKGNNSHCAKECLKIIDNP